MKNNMLWNSFGSIAYLISQWLVTVLVARLSTTGYDAAGVLAVAMSVSNIFAHIGLYKVRAYQVSDVNKEVSAREYVAFRLITIAVGFVVVMIYTFATCDASLYVPVALYLAYRGGETFIDVLHGVDQQNFRMDYCGKSYLIRGITQLVAFVAVFGATGDLSWAIVAMIAATFPVIAYDMRCAGQFDSLKPSIAKGRAVKLAVVCLPAVVGAVFYILVATVPRQYLSMLSGDAALGIYASVCAPAVLVQAGACYIYQPVLGLFAKRFADGDDKAFLSLLAKVTLGVVALFAVCFAAFRVAGAWFLELVFGSSIVDHVYLIYPALVMVTLTAYVSFMSDLLISIRDMRGNLIGNAVGFAAVLPCSVLLIRVFGANGISFSVCIAYALASGVMLVFMMRKLKGARA